LFHGAMHAADRAIPEPGSRFVQVSANPRVRMATRARLDEERATSARAVIASSLFLVLLAAALLVGGHAAIDPLLRSVIAARETKAVGDVLYTMPDGIFCRHMSFDNTTAEVVEGAVERCPTDIARNRPRTSKSFAWGEP
jgi:hypothetical protein